MENYGDIQELLLLIVRFIEATRLTAKHMKLDADKKNTSVY